MKLFGNSFCFFGSIIREKLWGVLPILNQLISGLGPQLKMGEYTEISPQVWVHKEASIAPTACLFGPTIVCKGATIKHCAFVRGGVLLCRGATIGAFSEVKNSVLMEKATVAHLSYVGDSVLGENSHFGAGVVASNLRLNQRSISVKFCNQKINTNLRKFGALVGDGTQVGCNSVLCPGTIIGANSVVYPLRCIKGTFESNSTIKENNA